MKAPPLPLWRMPRARYDRLVEAGVFGPDDRVELLDGLLVAREPQGARHATVVALARAVLEKAFGRSHHVREEKPIALDEQSEPEPDIVVVPGRPRDYLDAHPSRPVLVVEVAETSLTLDRLRKGGLYALAGVTDYWVVNLLAEVDEDLGHQVEGLLRGVGDDGVVRVGGRALLGHEGGHLAADAGQPRAAAVLQRRAAVAVQDVANHVQDVPAREGLDERHASRQRDHLRARGHREQGPHLRGGHSRHARSEKLDLGIGHHVGHSPRMLTGNHSRSPKPPPEFERQGRRMQGGWVGERPKGSKGRRGPGRSRVPQRTKRSEDV